MVCSLIAPRSAASGPHFKALSRWYLAHAAPKQMVSAGTSLGLITWEWEFANLQPQLRTWSCCNWTPKKKQRSAAPQNVLIIPSLLNVWLAFVSHFPSLKHLETMGKQWVLYRAGRVTENRSQRWSGLSWVKCRRTLLWLLPSKILWRWLWMIWTVGDCSRNVAYNWLYIYI